MTLPIILTRGALGLTALLVAIMHAIDRAPKRRCERYVATLSPELLKSLRVHEAKGGHWTEFEANEKQDHSRFS